MRNTESSANKGYKLQTLKAIESFFDSVHKHGKDAKIYIALEKMGDIYSQNNDTTEIAEVKNLSSPLSINSEAIKNTLINFIDIYIKYKSQSISFLFYSTSEITNRDKYKYDKTILDYLQTYELNKNVIDIIKNLIISFYKLNNTKNVGYINEIIKFTEKDWIDFLSKIKWNFQVSGNKQLSKELIDKAKETIKLINDAYLELNGIDVNVVLKIREQLEEKLENKPTPELFEFVHFENIVYQEVLNRTYPISRNTGKFLQVDKSKSSLNYFTDYEKKLIKQITDQFINTEKRNFILLTGKSSQGKTTLAYQIAYILEKESYLCLHIDATPSSNYIDLNLENIGREHTNVFCLISQSHLNFELINEIITYHERYSNIKFLFESRLIDKNLDDNFYFRNNEYLKHHELDFQNEHVFLDKFKGILETNLGTEKVKAIDIKNLIKQTGRNFLYLQEYIKFYLSGSNSISDFKKSIYNNFAPFKYQMLKDFAIINQFEIPIRCNKELGDPNFTELVNKNQLYFAYDDEKKYYNMYHSDFARLLINVDFEHKNFNSFQIIEKTKNKIIEYLKKYDYQEAPLILKSLYSINEIELLKKLLLDKYVKSNIQEFYSEPSNFTFFNNPTKPLRELLNYIEEIVPDAVNDYLEIIIFNNRNFPDYFKADESCLLTILKLSEYISNYIPKKLSCFNEKLELCLPFIPQHISFSTIAYYLSEMYRSNFDFYKKLKSIFTENILRERIAESEFLTLTEGLVYLYKFDDYKLFIDNLKFDPIKISQETTIDRYAKALYNLKSVRSKDFVINFFNYYSKKELSVQFQVLDIKNALLVANILTEFGYDKVHQSFPIHKFVFSYNEFSFSEITEILLEAHKFIDNKKKSEELINRIDKKILIDKIKNEDLDLIIRSLVKLIKHIGYRDSIRRLIKDVPVHYFDIPLNLYDDNKNVDILHNLCLLDLDNKELNNIYNNNYRIIENIDFTQFPFDRICLILRYLKALNPVGINKLAIKNESIIINKLQDIDLHKFGKSLKELYDVYPELSIKILEEIVKSEDFIKYIKMQKINFISKTMKQLYDLEIAYSKKSTNLFDIYFNLDNQTLVNTIKDSKFDVICTSLNEFYLIEHDNHVKSKNLINAIGIDRLIDSMRDNNFISLCTGLMFLNKIDCKFSYDFIRKAFNEILSIASKSELSHLSEGLVIISTFNKLTAKRIFNSKGVSLKSLAKDAENYNLDSIKKCIYYLKSFDLERTKKLLTLIDTDSFLYKFIKESNFIKSSEYLSQLYIIEKSKIEQVVTQLGYSKIFKICKDLDYNIVTKGLSEINKINEDISCQVLTEVFKNRDILNEIKKLKFDVFCKTMRETCKIEKQFKYSQQILDNIGVYLIAKGATNMSNKQINLGFGALKQVDFNFSKKTATKLLQLKPKLSLLFKQYKGLNELITQRTTLAK